MILEIKNLTKVYPKGKKALNDINMEIHDGMFGLLGPNGAGKSTLMKILVTLLKPTSGEIYVNGKKMSEHRKDVRSLIGYLPQDFRFFPKLRTWEFLDYAASLAGVLVKKERRDMVDKMLQEVALFDVRNRFANKLSGGMKRRLGIAQALIGNPKIIVVDEPTTGLDPEERIRFRNILSRLTKEEVIVILSTHIVGDISSSCNQMALINEGNLSFLGSPSDFVTKTEGSVWSIDVDFDQLQGIKEKYHVITSIPNAENYTLEVISSGAAGLEKFNPKSVMPNLEHAYVHFMESQNTSIIEN